MVEPDLETLVASVPNVGGSRPTTPRFNRSTAFTSVSFEDDGLLARGRRIGGSSGSNFRRATPWAETEEANKEESLDGHPLLKEDLVGTPTANNKEDVIDVDALYDGLLALPESRATSTHPFARDKIDYATRSGWEHWKRSVSLPRHRQALELALSNKKEWFETHLQRNHLIPSQHLKWQKYR
jgi:hypothetical protein